MGRKGRNAPDVRLRMCGIFRFVPFAATNHEVHVGRPPLGVGIVKLPLFCPGQCVNFLLGIQLEPLTPGTLLLFAMLTNLSGIQFRLKAVVNAALDLVATYSFANGMLLWLLAVPIRWPAERGEVRATIQSSYWMVRGLRHRSCNLARSLFF
jgi:hypothetical protein